MPPLNTLDLFSGVGGLTAAMHGFARPVAYCDIAPDARAVIHDNIRRKLLPAAPVLEDVREVRPSKLARKLDMIVAGFPCVGFSSLGALEGLDNEHSNLFYEILRIADESKAPLLFLENVRMILNIGMPEIVHQLVTKRGYELRWCVVSARMVGAPQQRDRWYCLAVRRDFARTWPGGGSGGPYARSTWTSSSEPARAVVPDKRSARARSALMGNSVVPDAARYAFMYLAGAMRAPPTAAEYASGRLKLLPPGSLQLPEGDVSVVPAARLARVPEWAPNGAAFRAPKVGGVASVAVAVAAAPPAMRKPMQVDLVLHPKSFKTSKPEGPNKRLETLVKPWPLAGWATPRKSSTRPTNYLTSRTTRDLPSQIRFERSTPAHLRKGTMAGEFTEWLMGYPKGWTRALTSLDKPAKPAAPATPKRRPVSG